MFGWRDQGNMQTSKRSKAKPRRVLELNESMNMRANTKEKIVQGHFPINRKGQ